MKSREVLTNALQGLGCSKDAVEVYLKLMTTRSLSISEIADRTGIQRTKCYLVIDELLEKQLVFNTIERKIKTFKACVPSEVLRLLQKQIADTQDLHSNFKKVLPELAPLHIDNMDKPKISYFQSKEAVKMVKQITCNHDFRSIFNPRLAYENNPEILSEYRSAIKGSNQEVRELITPKSTEFYDLVKSLKNPKHQVKFLPKSFEFYNDIILYDNKVFFMGLRPGKVGVLIEDADMYKSFSSIFEALWSAS